MVGVRVRVRVRIRVRVRVRARVRIRVRVRVRGEVSRVVLAGVCVRTRQLAFVLTLNAPVVTLIMIMTLSFADSLSWKFSYNRRRRNTMR